MDWKDKNIRIAALLTAIFFGLRIICGHFDLYTSLQNLWVVDFLLLIFAAYFWMKGLVSHRSYGFLIVYILTIILGGFALLLILRMGSIFSQ